MSSNFTGDGLILAATKGISVVQLVLIVIPSIILSGVCIIGLFLAKSINLQMRVVLINILFPGLVLSIGIITQLIGNIADARDVLLLQNFAQVCIIVGNVAKLLVVSFYAVMVYMFIKYSNVKIKWYVIVPATLISWIIPFLLSSGVLITWSCLGVEGITCLSDPIILGVHVVIAFLRFVFTVVSLIILITFTVLVYCYTSKNVISEDSSTKKAVAKNLVYLLVDSIILQVNFVLSFVWSALFIFDASEVIVSTLLQAVSGLLVLITPIVMLILLKPLRLSLKVVCGCKPNAVAPQQ